MTDELDEALPTCPQCRHPLEATGDEDTPYWSCPFCGYVALSA